MAADSIELAQRIAVATAAGDAPALAALSIELFAALAQARGELAALASADEARRIQQAGRTRKSRNRIRDITSGNVTQRDVTSRGVTTRDVTAPPSPSPSLSSPTTLLNPSPSPSPSSSAIGATKHVVREELEPLAVMLETADDVAALERLAEYVEAGGAFLPGWVAECSAALEGMHGPQLTPRQLGEALRDYVGNGSSGDKPALRHFRSYLTRVGTAPKVDDEKPRRARASGGNAGQDAAGDASLMLSNIRKLIQTVVTPGNGTRQFIPLAAVEALGRDVLEAYEAIGGAASVLGVKPDGYSFQLRDFAAALAAARRRLADEGDDGAAAAVLA